jgi:hypothetical protein
MTDQSRLEELKAKRVWLHGTEGEKAEYKVLTGASAEPAEKTDTITVKKEELMKMVEEIAESKVQKLREENQELQKHSLSLEKAAGIGTWQNLGDVKERTHTGRFKLWRANTDEAWKMIVDWKHLRFDYDEISRNHDKDIYKVTLMDEAGMKTDSELSLPDFAKILDHEIVDIIKMDKQQQVMKLGSVRRSSKKEGYSLSPGINLDLKLNNEANPWVDDIVTRDNIICTVRRKNGLQFQINADRLNA